GAAALLVTWVLWELRTPSPLFDLRLFGDRVFAGASGGMLVMGLSMMGSMFLLVIYMVNVLGYSELEAAVAVTPMPALGALLAPLVGKLLDHVSPRVPAAVGMLAMAAGLLLLRQLEPTATLWDVSWRTLLLGAGLGFAMPSLAIAGMSAVPHHAGGAGSGVINWARQMGFVLGVALLVAVFSHSMTASMTDAVGRAETIVDRQAGVPAPAKTAIMTTIEHNVAAASASPGQTVNGLDPLAGAPPAAGASGAPTAAGGALQDALRTKLTSVFLAARSDAFDLPLLVAACVALLGVAPALLLGPRRAPAQRGGGDEPRSPLADVV
ncbi:MAG TPA: MFS transporter, partial [Thermoleophilia bacterium]|nr:MFS transporter [Thermoleophilia bacterium]